mmetsp:Transcript_14721/g.48277  ORF Transcript_14721/g.48277 Transcript_14721/m.48277 type:complete len:393 (-) Transcript_14721:88-1266(-)
MCVFYLQVEGGAALRLAGHLLELGDDARKVLLEVGLKGGDFGRFDAEELVCSLHLLNVVRVLAGEHLRKGEAVRHVTRPLEEGGERARRLERKDGDVHHLGLRVGVLFAERDDLLDSVRLRARERERLADGGVRVERLHRHLGDVLRVHVRDARRVARAPHRLLVEDGHGVLRDERLHKAAQTHHGVVEPRRLKVLLRAVLEVHQRHLRVLVRLVDAEKDVPLDAHRLGSLDQLHLGIPIHSAQGLLRLARRAVHDGVDAHERRRQLLGLREVTRDCRCAPLAEEVGRDGARTHEASHVVSLVERSLHHLAAQRASGANHEHGRFLHGRRARGRREHRRRLLFPARPPHLHRAHRPAASQPHRLRSLRERRGAARGDRAPRRPCGRRGHAAA